MFDWLSTHSRRAIKISLDLVAAILLLIFKNFFKTLFQVIILCTSIALTQGQNSSSRGEERFREREREFSVEEEEEEEGKDFYRSREKSGKLCKLQSLFTQLDCTCFLSRIFSDVMQI